jgi:hypothetical protein
MKSTWSAVMIYEDIPTREAAVRFSDAMVRRFWSRCEFDFGWWSLAHLETASGARIAAEKAIFSDLIVFALRPEGPMPDCVLNWVEDWIGRRSEREGVLAGLLDPAAGPSGVTTERYLFLRSLAHRAGMDYLIQVPEDITRPIPDSLDSCAQRAVQKTSVLDEIMRRPIKPPQPKLNPDRLFR